MTTAEERKAHAAKLSRAWYASPAGQAYQLVLRERLFHPEWKLLPGPRKWRFFEDVSILKRTKSDRELAIKFGITMPAVRQRRYRLNKLVWTAGQHSTIAGNQISYSLRLQKALAK